MMVEQYESEFPFNPEIVEAITGLLERKPRTWGAVKNKLKHLDNRQGIVQANFDALRFEGKIAPNHKVSMPEYSIVKVDKKRHTDTSSGFGTAYPRTTILCETCKKPIVKTSGMHKRCGKCSKERHGQLARANRRK